MHFPLARSWEWECVRWSWLPRGLVPLSAVTCRAGDRGDLSSSPRVLLVDLLHTRTHKPGNVLKIENHSLPLISSVISVTAISVLGGLMAMTLVRIVRDWGSISQWGTHFFRIANRHLFGTLLHNNQHNDQSYMCQQFWLVHYPSDKISLYFLNW